MTLDAAEAVVKSMRCRIGDGGTFDFYSRRDFGSGLHVVCSWRVPEVQTGMMVRVDGAIRIDSVVLDRTDETMLKHRLYDMVRRLVLHELDEQLFFGGVHYRDPHPEG